MAALDKTKHFTTEKRITNSSLITIFDGNKEPRIIALDDFGKEYVYFGRSRTNDIVLSSLLVSAEHGRFVKRKNTWIIEDKIAYENKGSTNGLIYNDTSLISRPICDGDFIRIDDGIEAIPEGVLFVFSSTNSDKWRTLELDRKNEITIGRENDCDITLPHISVSKYHAKITREQDGYYITDLQSTNGVIVNNRRIFGKQKLHEKDVISITNSKLIFTRERISYCFYKRGISVDAMNIVIKRGKKKKSFITSDHVNLNISPGELVAIVGGSGAGKSTILNCMCGYLKPTEGEVFINGVNLYRNFDSLKKLIGYVPQSDIVYDNLTLYDMLLYTAKFRLPKDTTVKEREEAILQAMEMVELTEKRNSFIKNLSGGQRKRASIAVELLSDPNLLFLDEPASGLDPGIERNLMQALRKMADNGKTIILVTHSTLQLKMCDKIVFMGRGGKLCFYGSYEEALDFFETSDVVDIYKMISEQADYWCEKFEASRKTWGRSRKTNVEKPKRKKKNGRQLGTLSSRYLKLVMNDRKRLGLLFVQAILLGILISFVADGEQFEQYEMTKSLLFALSCSAFWIGMLNSIQEICKERTILKREYMTGLSLNSYILSKMIVLSFLCLIQSFLIVAVFRVLVGMPEKGILLPSFWGLVLTTFLTAVASSATGLFVSSFFTNADRAMTIAPLLLMPQILFSGLIFKLSGVVESLSWVAVCRWSMEGYGTIANLNVLPLRLQQEGVQIPHETEHFFKHTSAHLATSWKILLVYTVIFMILSRICLSRIKKENA